MLCMYMYMYIYIYIYIYIHSRLAQGLHDEALALHALVDHPRLRRQAPGGTCMYIYIYIYMYRHIHIYIYIIHTSLSLSLYLSLSLSLSLYMCIYIYIGVCVCMYIHTQTTPSSTPSAWGAPGARLGVAQTQTSNVFLLQFCTRLVIEI